MPNDAAFRLWAMGCSHVGTDLRHGRESLADAIRQSEHGGEQGGPAFDWDVALHLGDLSGSQTPPGDEEGREVVRQFGAGRHPRESFYNLIGNHDASGADEECQWWYRKWVDPEGREPQFSGVQAEGRPYSIDGTWERYSFRVGNILFLMLSDRNDGGPPVGRGERGGYPAGAVAGETFAWWRQQVEANQRDCIIVTAHHHMLRETTVASGPWEGFIRDEEGMWQSHYHGYFPGGGPEGASYLYFVDGRPNAGAFETYLAEHPGAIDLWLGGHTHTHPDDRHGGRSHVEQKWGVTFVNVAALTQYHVARSTVPMSRLFTFSEGRSEALVQCYLHTCHHAPQGWYLPAERVAPLHLPFRS